MPNGVELDTAKWSGEGAFTQRVIEQLQQIVGIAAIRVEDAPASRSEADYNFISNEIFVAFNTVELREQRRRFGFFPASRIVSQKSMTMAGLEAVLTTAPDIGAPDYSDDAMLQYLRAERIVPPYQTRGYKLVELLRVYETGSARDPVP
jgi:hypothetical protein